MKAAAQKYTTEALETLAGIMRSSENDTPRVAAARELLDRGHGKSHQSGDLTVKDDRMVVQAPLPEKTADEWLAKYGPH